VVHDEPCFTVPETVDRLYLPKSFLGNVGTNSLNLGVHKAVNGDHNLGEVPAAEAVTKRRRGGAGLADPQVP